VSVYLIRVVTNLKVTNQKDCLSTMATLVSGDNHDGHVCEGITGGCIKCICKGGEGVWGEFCLYFGWWGL
jgi:hypothetical protein